MIASLVYLWEFDEQNWFCRAVPKKYFPVFRLEMKSNSLFLGKKIFLRSFRSFFFLKVSLTLPSKLLEYSWLLNFLITVLTKKCWEVIFSLSFRIYYIKQSAQIASLIFLPPSSKGFIWRSCRWRFYSNANSRYPARTKPSSWRGRADFIAWYLRRPWRGIPKEPGSFCNGYAQVSICA